MADSKDLKTEEATIITEKKQDENLEATDSSRITSQEKYIKTVFENCTQKEIWDNISGPQPRVSIYDPATGALTNHSEETHTNIRKRFIADDVIDMTFLQDLQPHQITPDNGIIKYVVQEPRDKDEDPPIDRAKARIVFEGRLPNGELLDRERNRKEVMAVKIFHDNYIKGIHLATLSMRRNEIAWFKFAPEYHYGVNGFGNVPSNTDLYYKIEMIDYKNPQKSLDAHDFEPRIKIFEECRVRANEFFHLKNYKAAMKELTRSINLLKAFPKALKKGLTQEQTQTLHYYDTVINNNYAMNCIKEGEMYNAQKHLEYVLKIDPNNIKALYRKGIVEMSLSNFDKARESFKKVIELEPQNKESIQKLRELENRKRKSKQKEMRLFSKVFEKMPEQEKEDEEMKIIHEKLNRKRRRDESEERKTRILEEENKDDEDDFSDDYCLVDPHELEKGVVLDNTRF